MFDIKSSLNWLHPLRIVGVSLPLFALIFVPALQPASWTDIAPFKYVEPITSLVYYVVFAVRLDQDWLCGGAINIVSKLFLPLLLIVPTYVTLVVAAAAAGGAWAWWLTSLAMTILLVGLPIQVFSSSSLRIAGIFTIILASNTLLSGTCDFALEQYASERGTVGVKAALQALWWANIDVDFPGYIAMLLAFIPSITLFGIIYVLPPRRLGRDALVSALGEILAKGDALRDRLLKVLASAEHVGSGLGAECDNEVLSWSVDQNAEVVEFINTLEERLAVALRSAALEPYAHPGGNPNIPAWKQFGSAALESVEATRAALQDAVSMIQGSGIGLAADVREVVAWAAQASGRAAGIESSTLTLLAALSQQASSEEIAELASALRTEASRVVSDGAETVAVAASSAATRAIWSLLESGQPRGTDVESLFARDALLGTALEALVSSPVALARAAATAADAEALACSGPCSSFCAATAKIMRAAWEPFLDYAKALWKSACLIGQSITAPQETLQFLSKPADWSHTQKYSVKWMLGNCLLWTPIIFSYQFRTFLTKSSDHFSGWTFVAFNMCLLSTSDLTARKGILRFCGVVSAGVLTYVGILVLAWPESLGPVWQPCILGLYALTLLYFAVLIAACPEEQGRGWRSWAYGAQKFTYTFIGAFCGLYKAGLSRQGLVDNAWDSALAVVVANSFGILCAVLLQFVMWPRYSGLEAIAELRASALDSGAAVSAALSVLVSQGEERKIFRQKCVEAAASARAKLARGNALQKDAASFGGQFLGVASPLKAVRDKTSLLKSQRDEHDRRVELIRRARHMMLLAQRAACLLDDIGCSGSGLCAMFNNLCLDYSTAVISSPQKAWAHAQLQVDRSRESEQPSSYPTLLGTPYYLPVVEPEFKAHADCINALVSLAAAIAEGRPNQDTEALTGSYRALRMLRFQRLVVDARAATTQGGATDAACLYPMGEAIRFNALGHVALKMRLEQRHFAAAAIHDRSQESDCASGENPGETSGDSTTAPSSSRGDSTSGDSTIGDSTT